MSTMNNRRIPKLKINETMIKDVHYEIYKSTTGGTGSMKGCVMMSIDFAPPGGLVDDEIKSIVDFVVQDATNDYYAIGLETTKIVIRDNEGKDTGEKARHMHIRLVKKETTVVAEQKLVWHPFLAKGRCVWKDDNKMKRCYSLKIAACKDIYRPTQTPIKQMAYAMKESMGEYNNGITHWSNLLDDYDGSAQWCEDKAILDATVNKSKKKKEQRGEYNITVESQNSMAKKYAQLNGLEWSMDNHLEILATMLTDMTGPNAYYLSGIIQLPVKVRKRLGRLKGNDTYKAEYLEALEADADKTGGISTKQGKKLARENEKLIKKVAKLENICKGHVVTITSLKRKVKDLRTARKKHYSNPQGFRGEVNDCRLCCTPCTENHRYGAKIDTSGCDGHQPFCSGMFHQDCLTKWLGVGRWWCPCTDREPDVNKLRLPVPDVVRGAKRRRVEPIPEKSADHRRQDAIMAMAKINNYYDCDLSL